jgi:hypothetical protein
MALAMPVDPSPSRGGEAQLYLACPLTRHTKSTARSVASEVDIIKHAVEAVTGLDRTADEKWPVAIYAPIDHSAPWKADELDPVAVYRQNLSKVHGSDALIILAEKGGSAGIGQELEWATRLGLPTLFLSPDKAVSRQIRGTPAFVTTHTYADPEQLREHVINFMRRWKPVIIDGPRRRSSRRLRFEAITLRLRGGWQQAPNRTNIAEQLRVDFGYLELALSEPAYVATMPTDTLIALARELAVPLQSLESRTQAMLPVPQLRALMAAAAEDGWADDEIQRLLVAGHAALRSGTDRNLETLDAWRQLHQGNA